MRNAITLLVVGCLFGCSVDADDLRGGGAPYRGPGAVDTAPALVPDAGVPDTTPNAPDTSPRTVPDAVPAVDVTPPVDTGTASDLGTAAPDLGKAADVEPLSCTKLGPWSMTYALLIQLPATSYCFTVCPDATGPLDFAWSCAGFAAQDRNLAVNGKPVECGAKDMPPTVNGGWTFTLAAGSAPNAYIQWSGALKACAN